MYTLCVLQMDWCQHILFNQIIVQNINNNNNKIVDCLRRNDTFRIVDTYLTTTHHNIRSSLHLILLLV